MVIFDSKLVAVTASGLVVKMRADSGSEEGVRKKNRFTINS